MKKYFITQLISLAFSSAMFSQKITSRNIVDDKINITKNISYNPTQTKDKSKYFLFDYYQSLNNSTVSRPLIIWLHGGGFKYGSKNAKEIKIWGNEFAKRGFLFAAINYRLSKKHPVRKFKDLVSACYDGVDDANDAIHFFKLNAKKYNVDTNNIILGGNSAGAVVALQTVYSNRADLQNVIDSNKNIANTDNYNTDKIVAVINFWGALFDVDWLSRTKVPIISVCGNRDKVIPVTTKGVAFFGSVDIHKKADSLQISNDIKVYNGYAHELQKHFNPFFRSGATKRRWKDAADFTATALQTKLLKR